MDSSIHTHRRTDPPAARAYLGLGGEHPGVFALDAATRATLDEARLPPGQSCYSLDADHSTGTLAIGTRAGRVYITRIDPSIPRSMRTVKKLFYHGAPVLSVALLPNDATVATDSLGRCILHHRRESQETQSVTVVAHEHAICATAVLDPSHFIALSIRGELLLVDTGACRIVRVFQSTAPHRNGVFVRLLRYSSAQAFCYAGDDGGLVVVNLERGRCTSTAAHDGGFTAVGLAADHVVTVGLQDGTGRRWRCGESRPFETFSAPHGAVALAALDSAARTFVVVFTDGTAGIYGLREQGLVETTPLAGSAHRALVGPPIESLAKLERHRATETAMNLAAQAKLSWRARDREASCTIYTELHELNFGHIAEALRAEEAAVRNKPLDEIRARKYLYDTLPDVAASVPSFTAFARLAERWWQPVVALEAYRRIGRISDSGTDPESTRPLEQVIANARASECLFITDQPLDLLLQAAGIFERQFVGRWTLHRMKPIPLGRVVVRAEEVGLKYSEPVANRYARTSAPAVLDLMTWSAESTRRMRLITISIQNVSDVAVHYALGVLEGDNGLILHPMVVVHVDEPKAKSIDWNDRILRALREIRSNPTLQVRCSEIHGRMMHTLQRIVTTARRALHGAVK